MTDDFLGVCTHAKIIDAAHDEKVFHMERQYVTVKAVFHHFRGITASAHIDSRKVQVGHIAVSHVGRTVVQVAAALGNAVAENAHFEMFFRISAHFSGRLQMPRGFPFSSMPLTRQ